MTIDRQQTLLETEDSRYHAIEPFNTGTMMFSTNERFANKNVEFGLPSAPALFLNIARNAHCQRAEIDISQVFVAHRQGVWPDEHSLLFDYFEYFASEVIFSFTALEAFANEVIPPDFTYEFKRDEKTDSVTLNKSEIERRVSLDEKLTKIIPKAHDIRSPKGLKPWPNYKELKKVRDRLIHLKSIDRKSSNAQHQTIWGLMLEKHNFVFPDLAVRVIGHYEALVKDRRWFKLYVPVKT